MFYGNYIKTVPICEKKNKHFENKPISADRRNPGVYRPHNV